MQTRNSTKLRQTKDSDPSQSDSCEFTIAHFTHIPFYFFSDLAVAVLLTRMFAWNSGVS